RLRLEETPVFRKALERQAPLRLPMLTVMRRHTRTLVLGTVISLATFVLFYLLTVFSLTWGTTALGYSRNDFLILQLVSVLFFGALIPISAVFADHRGRRRTMLWVSASIAVFGLLFEPLLAADSFWGVALFLSLGLALMGLTYGPLGTQLSELFPTEVRYTGSSLSFNLAGIFGASLAPYIATWLASNYGLQYVGYYLSVAALLTLGALLMVRETRDIDMDATTGS